MHETFAGLITLWLLASFLRLFWCAAEKKFAFMWARELTCSYRERTAKALAGLHVRPKIKADYLYLAGRMRPDLFSYPATPFRPHTVVLPERVLADCPPDALAGLVALELAQREGARISSRSGWPADVRAAELAGKEAGIAGLRFVLENLDGATGGGVPERLLNSPLLFPVLIPLRRLERQEIQARIRKVSEAEIP